MQRCTKAIRFRTGPSTEVTIAVGERVPDVLAALVPADQQDRLAPLDDVQEAESAPESSAAPDEEPAPKRRRKSA